MAEAENTSSPSDSDLTAEFVRLMGENERSLRAFVLSLVPHWADADEIVQQTRVRIWEQFQDYDTTKNFGAWARTIAHYLVLSHREKLTRYPQLLSTAFLEAVVEQYNVAPPAVADREAALRLCMEKLDEPGRQLIGRYYSGDETMRDIGDQLGITANAVKHRMVRIRTTLAKCIERTLDQEDRT